MRLGAWRQILFANLTLAASLAATGCAGPANRNKQADATRRDASAPTGFAQADNENSPAQPYESAALRGTSEYEYDRQNGQLNPYANQDLSLFNPQNSLERDMWILRESERRQEQMLREMHSNPGITPDALQRQEEILTNTRQKIDVYDLALRQQDLNPAASGGSMDSFYSEMMNREQIQAMAPPDNHAFPPRSEVRLPQAGAMDASSSLTPSRQPSTRQIQDSSAPESERVVYDPRRDGEFALFAFPDTAADASPGSGEQTGVDGEMRKILIPPGSVPPSGRQTQAKPPVPQNPTPGQKPFAGAPVGRPMFPPKQKAEMPDDWTPPADLFSQSSASDEVQARPGLFSADGRVEQDDWPTQHSSSQSSRFDAADRATQQLQQVRKDGQAKASGNDPVQVKVQVKPVPVVERKSLRPETGNSTEKPVITIPSPAPASRTAAPAQKPAAKQATPPARTAPAPAPAADAPSDEVFVPDMIFSRR